MNWPELERLFDSVVALYLVIHGVFTPPEGRRHLLVSLCHAAQARFGSWARRVSGVAHLLK